MKSINMKDPCWKELKLFINKLYFKNQLCEIFIDKSFLVMPSKRPFPRKRINSNTTSYVREQFSRKCQSKIKKSQDRYSRSVSRIHGEKNIGREKNNSLLIRQSEEKIYWSKNISVSYRGKSTNKAKLFRRLADPD